MIESVLIYWWLTFLDAPRLKMVKMNGPGISIYRHRVGIDVARIASLSAATFPSRFVPHERRTPTAFEMMPPSPVSPAASNNINHQLFAARLHATASRLDADIIVNSLRFREFLAFKV